MTRPILPLEEKIRFDECNYIISEGLQTCFAVGAALTEIRDSKLYRENFDSFEDFCRVAYQIGRHRAMQLIEASEVKNSVELQEKVASLIVAHKKDSNHPISGSQVVATQQNGGDDPHQMAPLSSLIKNPQQTRALAKVPAENRVAVLAVAAANGAVTGKSIGAAAKQVKDPTAPVVFDKVGRAIPPKILPLWRRAEEEAKVAMDAISKLRCALKASQDDEDILYREMAIASTIGHLSNAYGDYQTVAPYAVCHLCQGMLPQKCNACKERGFVSKFRWDTCVPKEFKTLFTKGK